MPHAAFDDSLIQWQPFGRYQGFQYALLHVDSTTRTMDMLFRFEPNADCFYHRHVAPSRTLVLAGEYRVREPQADGTEILKIRQPGSYAAGEPGDVHIEGGGPTGCILHISITAPTDHVYDILDEQLQIKRSIGIADFENTFKALQAA